MSKTNESDVKTFLVPESLPAGYGFMAFIEYVIDRVPEFQTVSGSRKGGKLIDAVAAAMKKNPPLVRWPTDLWNTVVKYLNSDAFQMPKNYLTVNGNPTDQLLPLRYYLPFADTILEAKDLSEETDVAPPLPAESQPS